MKRILCFLLITLYLCSSFVTVNAAKSETNTMNIYGLYLTKTGDATLIESNGKWLLIDAGDESSAKELLNKLSSYGVREVDVLISHYHNDHTGGFAALADSTIKINRLFIPDPQLSLHDPEVDWKQKQLRKAATQNNDSVIITTLKKSDTFTFGGVTATVLGPVSNVTPDDFEATADQPAIEIYANCRSLTVRFDCGSASFLSAGDIEQQEEKALIKAYAGTNKLDVDVMKLSHHGLHTSNTAEFLAMITPEVSFAHNSGKTISEGMDYRMYYTSCKNASAYGPVYLIGDEKADIRVAMSQDRITLYKGTKELKGLVELTGGDGTVTKTYKYYITGSHVKEGVYTIDGKKYYVSDGGFVNKAYYSHLDDRYIYWHEPIKGGDVRYFDTEGVMQTGFFKVSEYYYYFDSKTGLLHKGDADKDLTIVTIEGKKYALYPSGVVYNYGKDKSVWREFGDDYRYFDTYGVMQTGWLTLGEKKYYLDPETGLRAVGLREIDGSKYYFVETNNAAYAWSKGWKNFDGQYRYFETDGKMKTGWFTSEGKKYYLDDDTGLRSLGLKEIDGVTYYFVENNNAGYALCNSSITINGKVWRFGSDGSAIGSTTTTKATTTTQTTSTTTKATSTTKNTSATTTATTTTATTTATTTTATTTTATTTTATTTTTTTATTTTTTATTTTTTTKTTTKPTTSHPTSKDVESTSGTVDNPTMVTPTEDNADAPTDRPVTDASTSTIDTTTNAIEDTTAAVTTTAASDDKPVVTQPDSDDNAPSPLPLIILISAIVIIGVAIVVFVLLRKKNH